MARKLPRAGAMFPGEDALAAELCGGLLSLLVAALRAMSQTTAEAAVPSVLAGTTDEDEAEAASASAPATSELRESNDVLSRGLREFLDASRAGV